MGRREKGVMEGKVVVGEGERRGWFCVGRWVKGCFLNYEKLKLNKK